MKALLRGVCVVALLLTAAPNVLAVPNYAMGLDGVSGASWQRSLALAWDASVAPFGFNEVRLAYRPDLEAGGGAFQAPIMDDFRDGGPFPGPANFAGPARFDWSLSAGGATYARANGALISGSWLPFRVTHSGDGNFETGFSFARYLDGQFVSASALVWSQNTGQFLARTQDEWDQDWAQAVPEPATLALLGLGLAGAGAARRRKRKP